METTKIVPMPGSRENDPDCFIRLCNSPEQQRRRMARLRREQRKRVVNKIAEYAAVVLATIVFLALIGAAL